MTEISGSNHIMGMHVPGARFGTCISRVGDLNNDGFIDIAVGAPYENEGKGAIYIYHGLNSGINPKYSQRIAAEQIHPALTGFGISISRGLDIDNNNYNDIAVGAFSSGHGVLIRSRPVIKFTSSLGNDDQKIGINDTEFSITACLSYQGTHSPPSVAVQIFLAVWSKTEIKPYFKTDSGGGLNNNTYSFYTTLQYNKDNCKVFRVELVKGNNVHEDSIDYTQPFEMKMSYSIDERKLVPPKIPNTVHSGEPRRSLPALKDTFCKKCPVVDPNDVLTITKNVPYATGCKNLICHTDLAVSVSFEEGVGSHFIIGSRTNLRMKIVVDNSGESAYLAKVNVEFSSSTPLIRIPPQCQEVSTSQEVHLECDVGNPLKTGSQALIYLEMGLKDLPSSLETLLYRFNATSLGSDAQPDNNVQVLTLALEAEADMEITGISTQNQLVYLPEKSQTFSHKYEVINYGPSPALATYMEFLFPVAYDTGKEIITFLEVYDPKPYLNDQQFDCKPDGSHKFSKEKSKDVGSIDGKFSLEENLETKSRRKRAPKTDSDSLSLIKELPMNMTFLVSCTDEKVLCMTVKCDSVGPFHVTHSRALLNFRMKENLTKLAPILGAKDIIVVSSSGTVTIKPSLREKQPIHGRADNAAVSTVFYGTLQDQPLAAWIWILAIAGGIALLLIITGVLYKLGFFRRKQKEDLQSLKDNDCVGAQVDSMNNEGFEAEPQPEGE